MTFHLHTQSADNLPDIVAGYFPAFTLTPGTGYWNGTSELSCTIEIETTDRLTIETLARRIALANRQDAVLIECFDSTGELIMPDKPIQSPNDPNETDRRSGPGDRRSVSRWPRRATSTLLTLAGVTADPCGNHPSARLTPPDSEPFPGHRDCHDRH